MSLLAAVTEHWQLKLLSIVFAVALWAFVVTEDTSESAYTVPLDLTDVPPGTEVTAVGVETLDVRVQGVRHVLARLQERDLRATVSIRDARPGDVVARISPENVRAPRGVQVVRVIPSRVRATLERVARARVEVAPRVVGRPAPGYRVAAVRVEPRQVEIRVPGRESVTLRQVDTAPVDIEGAQATVTREVGLAAPAGVEVADARRRVAVTVEVVRR